MVVLVLGIHKVLDFSHLELTDTKQAGSGVDLVSKSETNLSASHRHLSVVELVESSEVDEDTLGSLRPQETLELASGSDLRAEHEVESLSV